MGLSKRDLAKWLMFQVPAGDRAQGGLELKTMESTEGSDQQETKNAPVFANYKAVTFPGLVVVIGGAWAGLQQLGVPALTARWVPFGLCMALGGFLTWLELTEDQVTPKNRKVFGGMIGLCNCLVLFSAVVGGQSLLAGGKSTGGTTTALAPAEKTDVSPSLTPGK